MKHTHGRWGIGVALVASLVLTAGCAKSGEWVVGKWLLVDEEGKPGVCHEFKKERTFLVYAGSDCSGPADQSSSGRWEAKEETKLALLRYNERKAALALVTEKDAEHFVSRGALAGTFYRVGEQGAGALLARLDEKGLIKVKALPAGLGCQQIALSVSQVRSLPTEKEPRMLRQKDQALEYHAAPGGGEPAIEKVVYALNGDQLEWMALHLSSEAFAPPGPEARLQTRIGKPLDAVATGTGEKRQHIVMWKSYCAQGRDVPKRDLDVTLFATAGAKRGTLYLSDNVVSGLWDDLKHVAKDPSAQTSEEDEEGKAAEPKPTGKASPPAAPPPAPAAKTGPAPVRKIEPTPVPPAKAAPTKAAPTKAAPAKAAPTKAAQPKPGPAKSAPEDDDDL